ncbi:nonribosomal peptide synthase [Aspergillus niger]|nr:nonribosomal peptide synthase [Aspergillus niger]
MGSMEDLPVGVFPTLVPPSSSGHTEFHAREISPDILTNLLQSSIRKEVDLIVLLRSIWAIVLRQYVESDGLCFKAGSMTSACSELDMLVYQAGISSHDTPEGIWRQQQITTGISAGGRNWEVNTGVFLLKPCSDRQWRARAMQAVDACLVMEEVDANAPRLYFLAKATLLSRQQVQYVADTVAHVASEILRKPNQTLRDTGFFSPQHAPILHKWNHRTFWPGEGDIPSSILDAIRRHSQRSPDALAIVAWDGSISYGDLEARSTCLAEYLRRVGVGPGVMVPLLLDHSQWVIITQLAVLKAGAAFVPLEPSHPQERLRYIVRCVKAFLIVASEAHCARARQLVEQVIPINESIMNTVRSAILSTACITPTADAPAYVLFTSGSTGQPKGCVIDHRAMAQLPHDGVAASVGPDSRVLQFATYSFTMAIYEIYWCLSNGGTLCIPSDHDRLNNLPTVIEEMQVTWAVLTPSVLRRLSHDNPPSSLQTLALGGEPLAAGDMEAWVRKLQVFFGYASSEGTALNCLTELSEQSHALEYTPTPRVRHWIVDPDNHDKLAAMGTVGELIVESPGLAREYLDNPTATAAAFIQSPDWRRSFRFSQDGSQPIRMYKTGDLFRYTERGNLQYVGRKATQVKIRGQRLDLGEVEYNVSQQCPAPARVIAETGVPRDGAGTMLLVAFLYSDNYTLEQSETTQSDEASLFAVPSDQFRADMKHLTQALEPLLPAHMLPSNYIPLRRFPSTLTGKADRRLLRELIQQHTRGELERYQSVTTNTVAPPSTRLERDLHGLFAEVLGINAQDFGIHHSFISLGGDSLAAMKLVNLSRKLGLRLTVAQIMESKTVAKLSNITLVDESSVSTIIPLRDGPLEAKLPLDFWEGIEEEHIEFISNCSTIQQGILLGHIRNPAHYHNRIVWEVLDPPAARDIDRMRRAWAHVCRRHPMLRTFFVEAPAGNSSMALQITLKVSHFGPEDVDVLYEEPEQMPSTNPALASDQPLQWIPRLRIYEVTGNRLYCAIDIHHVQVDMISLGIIIRDLRRCYLDETEYVAAGDVSEPNSVSYTDYAQYLVASQSAESLSYWRIRLAHTEPCIFPRLQQGPFEAASSALCSVELPLMPMADHLQSFCKDTEVTVATVFKLAWSLVLSAYTGSRCACYGSVTAMRDVPLADVEDLVGPLINTLPFCVELNPDERVMNVLRRVQNLFLEELPHRQVSIAELQHSLNNSSGTLFNTTMSFVDSLDPAADSQHPIRLVSWYGPTEYDLVVEVTPGHPVSCCIRYWSHMMSDWQASALADTLAMSVSQILRGASSGKSVGSLDLCTARDKQKLVEWNGSPPQAVRVRVHDLIKARCIEQPDALAVWAWDGALSYRELDCLSSNLARRLMARGVGPEAFVGICFDRCKWTLVSVLAVAKAGGAFCLMDSSHPTYRLREICDALGANLVITTPTHVAKVSKCERPLLVVVEGVCSETDDLPGGLGSEHRDTLPRNALYAVFTSGSTGKPKGVVITHENLAATIKNCPQRLDLRPGDRSLHFASYAFDFSIIEVIVPMVVGACVCIPSEHDRLNNLPKAMADLAVTWAIMTPTVSRLLEPASLPTLRTLVLGGEAIMPYDFTTWQGYTTLISAYSPAECTPIGLCTVVQADDPNCLGKPFTSMSPWIVDPENVQRLVPVGAVGELVIEGTVVGRGYLHDAEHRDIASSPFIPPTRWLSQYRTIDVTNPSRLYRTGDLVQFTEDGAVRFIGRKDLQVKIRGQRLELGEVESRLRSYLPWAGAIVVEAVVLKSPSGRAVLVAFISICSPDVTDNAETVCEIAGSFDNDDNSVYQRDIDKALSHLGDELPNWMVPSVVLKVQGIPMTKSGKVDRRRLRQLATLIPRETLGASNAHSSLRQAPVTEEERRLQMAFANILQMRPEEIFADSHFFQLGGDSVGAMELVAAARLQNMGISVSEIFQHPTLSGLAAVATKTMDEETSEIPPFSLLPSDYESDIISSALEQCALSLNDLGDIYPCTAFQEGLMALASQKAGKYVCQCLFELGRDVEINKLKTAWQATVTANDILRTRIIHVHPHGTFQVVLTPAAAPIFWHRYETVNEWRKKDMELNMELGTTLARFSILSSAQGQTLVGVSLHHAIYDGVSLPRLFDQVQRAYQNEHLPLNKFTPFIRSLILQNPKDVEEFWRTEFHGLQASVFPGLPEPGFVPNPTASVEKEITFPRSPHLPRFTLSTVMRLAWALLVSYYTDSEDVVFGVTVSGRARSVPGINLLTGPSMATVPFRTRICRDSLLLDALRDVQDHSMRMIPFEQAGLQRIRELSDETSVACGFQSQLVIQHGEHSQASPNMMILRDQFADHAAFLNYALVILCTPSTANQTVRVNVQFDPQIVLPAVADRLLSQFAHIVDQMCAPSSYNARLGGLETINPQDWTSLRQWNGSLPAAYPHPLHHLVLSQAETTPDRRAVESWDGTLTYAELNDLSGKLGQHLLNRGLKQGSRVVLLFDRSLISVVTMLAVLRSGGICVNIDPSLPQTRITQTIHQARPSVALVSSTYQSRLADALPVPVLTIALDTIPRSAKNIPWPLVRSTDLAFILFTSGTTGKPKGIMVEHGNCATDIFHYSAVLAVTPEIRTLHFCSYAFDLSIYEVLTPWMHGGCLCIPSESARLSDLPGVIQKYHVNFAILTPSVGSALHPSDLPSLQTLILGGEVMPAVMFDRWASHVRLINLYGPAEATQCAALHLKPTDEFVPGLIGAMVGASGWVTVPGSPNCLAPIGAVGELLIEGPAVTRGYFDEMEQTQASYIDPPAWLQEFRGPAEPGRLFCSGDLVQYVPNRPGWLRYIGRKDKQVKIRAQRVDLTEVEHHVDELLPPGSQAIAEVLFQHSSPSQSSQLAVFLAFGEQLTIKMDIICALDEPFRRLIAEIHPQLQKSLPSYMVPTLFFPVSHVPQTPTGKTDRNRLRQLVEGWTTEQLLPYHPFSTDSARAPVETAEERIWQHMWCEVLCIRPENIARTSHFFHLGGESVRAMRLAGLAQREGWIISVPDIFAHPTLSEMASFAVPSPKGVPVPSPDRFSLIGSRRRASYLVNMATHQCNVTKSEIEDIYPCTPLQETLIASTVQKGGSYQALEAFDLIADVDLERLEMAWQKTAADHAILRTRIMQDYTGELFQVVVKGPLACTVEQADKNAENGLLHFQRTMGIGTPLIHLVLLQSPGSTIPDRLLLSIHHALYDGWSLPLLLEEVNQKYIGPYRGQDTTVPFNVFVSHVIKSMDRCCHFWKQELEAKTEARLFPRLPDGAYEPHPQAMLQDQVSVSPTRNESGITLATMVQASWALTVSCYLNASDVGFGITTSGRAAPVPGIDRLLGPTLATLPRRIHIQSTLDIKLFLRQLQQRFTEQSKYEHIGLQQIRQLGASAASACRFQTLLVIQPDQPKRQLAWAGNHQSAAELTQFSNVALTLICQLPSPSSTSIGLTAVYDPRVLAPAQMQRVLSQVGHVFRELQDAPDGVPIASLNMLNPSDSTELQQWNELTVPTGKHQDQEFVHDMIRRRCQLQPDAVAVEAWDGSLTYGELDSYTEYLAAKLQLCGVRNDHFIALYFEKSCWTIVAQLAVLKAGGALVMLEPSHPVDRRRDICQTLDVMLILGPPHLTHSLEQELNIKVLPISKAHLIVMDGEHLSVDSHIQSHNLMYAIATSGTTGCPKLALVHHGGFVATARTLVDRLLLLASSRVLQFSSYGFDASLVEQLLPLIVGGCVCVPTPFDRDNRLAFTMATMKINWMVAPASVIHLLSPDTVPTLQTLISAGEPLQQSIIDVWATRVNLINAYGPAECSMVCSVNPSVRPGTDPNNIGYPIGGTCWIVDPNDINTLLPIGAEGELLVEGPNVGVGYAKDPRRTRVAFSSSPPHWLRSIHGDSVHTRIYRTGDIARYNPDGSVHYVGRKDSQIKLHGQRIELAEVEQHVRLCFPGAIQVVVEMVKFDDFETSSLVALIVLSSSGFPASGSNILLPTAANFLNNVQHAEALLQDRIPLYMIPTLFVPVAQIPFNTNGKADRARLRTLVASLSIHDRTGYRSTATTKPNTDLEIVLHGIWSRVLRISPQKLGIHESFFRVGGNSISSMQLAAQCNEAGLPISVQDIFRCRTISRLASSFKGHPVQADRSLEAHSQDGSLGPVQRLLPEVGHPKAPVDSTLAAFTDGQLEEINNGIPPGYEGQIQDIYPCSHAQQGMLISNTRNSSLYQQVYRFEVVRGFDAPKVDCQQLVRAWHAVVKRHGALRTVFLDIPGRGFHQIVLVNARDNVIIAADGNHSSTCTQKRPGTQDLYGPLPTLIIHQEYDERLWIELHISHALLDGVSLRIIEQDLVKAYYNNLPSSLPDYRDYVTYLRAKGDTEISLSYWKKYLEGAQPCLFPRLRDSTAAVTDVSEPKATVDFVSLDLGPPKSLDQLCETHCLSLTAILHVVWAIVLQQYTGTDSVCFGYATSARHVPIPHVDEIVGPMINTLPSQIQLSRDSSVLSTLQKYTVHFMSCMEHAYVSLGQILHSAMSSTQSPFNTMITIVETGDRRDDADGSCLSLVGMDGHGETEYALALTVSKASSRMDLHLSYQTSMVNASQAHDVCLMFQKVLCEVLERPTAKTGAIDALNMGQRQRMESRQPTPPAAANTLIYETINRRCAEQPSSSAVCAWDGEFTYGEIDRLSSVLAGEILALGVKPEDPVLVCLEKSRWVPVVMLAVWKAGACLVLLDATHPTTRLHMIAKQSAASLAIANRSTRSKANILCSRVLQIDDDRLWTRHVNSSRAEMVHVDGHGAAYIIFTSGSTGTPKGAVIEHASLSIAWETLITRLQLNPTSRVLQFASHSWDATIIDVMAAFMSGGCLCVPSENERMGHLALAANRMRANWMLLTPTVARQLTPSEFLYLETLVLGGERVNTTDIEVWHDKVCLLSAYGPAECTQITSVTRPLDMTCDARNIGIPNASAGWVVRPDDPEQLVPDGAIGELLIEGPIVGQGYLNEPQSTYQAFIEAPSWLQAIRSSGTVRVYRTGDLVRFAADGSLIFVGRMDDQVKLHGQRLELGEVEHHVQQAFAGSLTVIDLIQPEEEQQMGPFLAACIFSPGHACKSPSHAGIWEPPSDTFRKKVQEARTALYQSLPSYMVPSVFLPLAYLPKATTGKIDRKRLRNYILDMSQEELNTYSSPDVNWAASVLTLMETRLQDHISSILHKQPWQVSPDQDLFQLGMDSVLAMALIARLYKDGLKLTVRDIFEQPQLRNLALVVRETLRPDQEGVRKAHSRSPLLHYAKEIANEWKMALTSIEHILPTTHFQRESLEARHKVYFIFHFHGKIDCQRLQHAVQAAVDKYAILRTVFIPWDESTVQITLGDATVPVEITTTDLNPVEIAGSICREDSSAPVAPGKLHTQLRLIMGSNRDSMALRLSHAQYDGISMPRLFTDIARAYQGITLSPAKVDFPEYLHSRIYNIPSQAYKFWRDLLRGSSMTYLRSESSSGSPPFHNRGSLITSTTEVSYPPAPAGTTMATVAKAAWALCLAHMAGTHDIVFGQLVNGRNLELPEAETVVGACVNYVPVRVTLQADWTVSSLLHAVHQQQTRSMSFETLEYDELVAQCTSWPADTDPGTGIHYVNIPDAFAGSGLPGVGSDYETYVSRLPYYHPRVTCSPLSKGTLELTLYVSDQLWDQNQADQTLHLFGQTVVRILENPTGLALDVLKH